MDMVRFVHFILPTGQVCQSLHIRKRAESAWQTLELHHEQLWSRDIIRTRPFPFLNSFYNKIHLPLLSHHLEILATLGLQFCLPRILF